QDVPAGQVVQVFDLGLAHQVAQAQHRGRVDLDDELPDGRHPDHVDGARDHLNERVGGHSAAELEPRVLAQREPPPGPVGEFARRVGERQGVRLAHVHLGLAVQGELVVDAVGDATNLERVGGGPADDTGTGPGVQVGHEGVDLHGAVAVQGLVQV